MGNKLLVLAALAAPVWGDEPIQVRFVVSAPEWDAQAPAEIHCSLSLDGWPEGGRVLKSVAPGLYEATWKWPANTTVEYKFLRTKSWKTVEKGSAGEELPNRTLQIQPRDAKQETTRQIVFHQIARWADRDATIPITVSLNSPTTQPARAAPSTLTGDIRRHEKFHSPQLNNDRTILVYLPPDYEKNPGERYSVLYMHDGNNVFDAATSFAGVEWSADETAEKLIRAGRLQKIIIVGVYNNADRMKEYTPWADAQYKSGGDGDAYLRFIVETVKPFIDKTYRTRPEREHTVIAGSSLGGLISLYAIVKYSDVFGGAGVVSPALWWADARILEAVRAAAPQRPVKLWIDMGTAERGRDEASGTLPRAITDCRRLIQILKEQGLVENSDFHYEEIAGGAHNEKSWVERFDRILLYFFAVAEKK